MPPSPIIVQWLIVMPLHFLSVGVHFITPAFMYYYCQNGQQCRCVFVVSGLLYSGTLQVLEKMKQLNEIKLKVSVFSIS